MQLVYDACARIISINYAGYKKRDFYIYVVLMCLSIYILDHDFGFIMSDSNGGSLCL